MTKLLKNNPHCHDNMRVEVRFGESLSVCEYVFGDRKTLFIVDPLDLLAEIQ